MTVKNNLLTWCAVVICAVVTVSVVAQDDKSPAGPQSWEHMALQVPGDGIEPEASAQIIRLGREGWQLACVSSTAKEGTTDKTIYYFKRPL